MIIAPLVMERTARVHCVFTTPEDQVTNNAAFLSKLAPILLTFIKTKLGFVCKLEKRDNRFNSQRARGHLSQSWGHWHSGWAWAWACMWAKEPRTPRRVQRQRRDSCCIKEENLRVSHHSLHASYWLPAHWKKNKKKTNCSYESK